MDTDDLSLFASSIRPAPRLVVPTDLAQLQARADELARAAEHQASTRATYDRAFERWAQWCIEHGIDPLCGDERLVMVAAEQLLGPCATNTALGLVRGVSARWKREGLPGIYTGAYSTGVDSMALSVAKGLAAKREPRKVGARPLTPELWGRVLAAGRPGHDATVALRQAALHLARAGGTSLSGRGPLPGVRTDAVSFAADGTARVLVDGVEVVLAPALAGPHDPLPDDLVCPVAALTALVDDAGDRELLFGADLVAAKAALAATHEAAKAKAIALRFVGATSRTAPVAEFLAGDGLERMCWLLDFPRCAWLHDQLLLILQLVGGFRPTSLAAAVSRQVQVVPHDGAQALRFHLPRHKGDPEGVGSNVTLPGIPARPDLCPVQLLTTWRWLLGLGPNDPLLPPGTPNSIYRREHQHTTPDAARTRFAAPLKERLVLLGEDTRGRAGTTGRHTIGTTAADAGCSLLEIADHLTHRSTDATVHYIERASASEATRQMAAALAARGGGR
jgi:hypothetical protein